MRSVPDLFLLADKKALVTGAGSGIGRQIAIALDSAGAELHLLGRRHEKLAETAAQLDNATRIVERDLAKIDDWSAFVQSEGLEEIDILYNAAGVNLRQPWEDISPDSWDATLNINLKFPFFLAQAIAPHMRDRRWGKIVNIASLQSFRAFRDSIAYGASKGGIAQLTRAMAEAWSASGVCCNAIAPGFFPTALTQPIFDDARRAEVMARQTAVGRNGSMADLNGISIFLASHASDYITGQVIAIDGGFSAK